MSMHRNFGEWYRQVSIPCTDDSLKKRVVNSGGVR